MFTSLKIFILIVCTTSLVSAERNYGESCKNVNCASTQQCLGLYEPCQTGQVDGTHCGFYAACVDREGEVKHTDRPASSSNVANDPKPIERNLPDVGSSDNASNNNGQLYPSLPPSQPNYPSYPQGGFYPPNQQGGSYPPNPQGGSYPPNPQGGYYPQNPQGGYYPQNPQGGFYPNVPSNPQGYAPQGDKKDSANSGSGSGFNSLLNLFSGGDRGSSGGSSGGPDLGSLLNILGKGNSGSSGSGGLDFSSLLSTFTGSGGRGSGQNSRNDFDNRNPTDQNPPNSRNSGQNPNQAQDSGPNFLQSLASFATSPLGQQILVRALQNNKDNGHEAQQSRRFGGLFSENTDRTQTVAGAGSRGYPTQASYTPQNNFGTKTTVSLDNSDPSSSSLEPSSTHKPYGWNV